MRRETLEVARVGRAERGGLEGDAGVGVRERHLTHGLRVCSGPNRLVAC